MLRGSAAYICEKGKLAPAGQVLWPFQWYRLAGRQGRRVGRRGQGGQVDRALGRSCTTTGLLCGRGEVVQKNGE